MDVSIETRSSGLKESWSSSSAASVERGNLLLAFTAIGLLIAAVFGLYWPSLHGPFIFDDIHNLTPLGSHHELESLQQILIYVTREGTSWLDRPLSRLSFYINDWAWPSAPAAFRYTNIGIHVLNGLLVWWLSFRLIRLSGLATTERSQILLATCIALAWALHPIHVHATAYIIQRMTQLSATFVLAGLVTYTYGREQLALGNTSGGLWRMSLAVVLFLPLAFLSKQNGVLLPLFIAVVEFTLLQQLPHADRVRKWALVFLAVPVALTLVGLILKSHEKVFSFYDSLPFTPWERLLTETRVLLDYVARIILPRARTSSLFHDDYPISHSLVDPVFTLFAALAVVVALALVLFGRRRWPVLAFACGWFLVGHALESSILGLELYYEHRNYLPSFGILFALFMSGYGYLRLKPRVAVSLVACLLALLAFVTYLNTSIWKSEFELVSHWYQANPDSIRTNNVYAGYLNEFGKQEQATEILLQSQQTWPRRPDNPLMLLFLGCLNHTLNKDSLDQTIGTIPADYDYSNTLNTIMGPVFSLTVNGSCAPVDLQDLDRLLLHLVRHPAIQNATASIKWKLTGHYLYLKLAGSALRQGRLAEGIAFLNKANDLYPSPDVYVLAANWLAASKDYAAALEHATRGLKASQAVTLNAYLNPHQKEMQALVQRLEARVERRRSANE
jgi:tetratricopeptide (TPR) repeat protein